jgi:DNA invertase Pin-like site-specific DNA recombinase
MSTIATSSQPSSPVTAPARVGQADSSATADPIDDLASRVGYERLSLDRSLRRISVTIQRDEIDDYAVETGKPIAQHFTDNDKSASEFSTKPRKDYIELLAGIMRGLVREIIVTEVPRLSRRTDEALELIRLSKTTPLRFVTTTDGMVYDLRTPRGRKAFREAVSDAEFESAQTSSRQHRRSNMLAEAGAAHGGQRAYGYEGAKYEELTTPDGERPRPRYAAKAHSGSSPANGLLTWCAI